MWFHFLVFLCYRLLGAVWRVQEFWRDTAYLSWKLLKDSARLALWSKMWRWLSREFTPSPWLTSLLCPSSNQEFPSGPPQVLPQRKAKQGIVGRAHNRGPREAFWFVTWCQKQLGRMNHILSAVWALPQFRLFFLFTFHASFFALGLCMLLLGGTMCLSGRAIVRSTAGPTKCSRCLQPYGIAWQRTQTFLIESSPSENGSGQFSGKTALCFQNLVHQQVWVELVPMRTPLGGAAL